MKSIISTLLSGLVILMAGCSSEIPGNSESQITSGGSILRLDINKADMTRAGLESTSFDEGDEVFVVVTDRTNPDILTVTTKATYTGSKWVLADEIDLAGGNSGVVWTIADIQVYYPYDMALEGYDKESGKINLNFFQKDILYGASYGWSKGNANATVSCKHAMTRLTLALNNNSNADATVERVKITNEGEQSFLGSKGILDSDGIRVTGYANEKTFYKSGNKISAGATGYYDILLPPTSAAYEQMLVWFEDYGISKTILKFEVEVDDRTVKFDIDANAWEEGHQYTYPVNIKEPEKPEYSGIIDGHEYVDLGLSVKWATCNVGASTPSDYGDYFAWGETTSKSEYIDTNSKTYGKNLDDISGNLEYDAATYNWGERWRMPTKSEYEELVSRCEWFRTEVDGKNGYKVVASNGNSIFFPAAGWRSELSLFGDDSVGYYWSSTPDEESSHYAYEMYFQGPSFEFDWYGRSMGSCVRPVAE